MDSKENASRLRAALALLRPGDDALQPLLPPGSKRVVVVSSGDPGVFAMASAVFEALEGRVDWQALDIRVLPGITAMLAGKLYKELLNVLLRT